MTGVLVAAALVALLGFVGCGASDEDAEVLRGASTIDGIRLDQVLADLGRPLTSDDDVYTARLTSLVAGRHRDDGSFEPMFDHLHTWVVRRHHVMEAAGCDKLDSPDSCLPCAWFHDIVDFLVPGPPRFANPFGATVRLETTTGTEGAEAEAAGLELCG